MSRTFVTQSVIKLHTCIDSSKHLKGKERLSLQNIQEKAIDNILRKYDSEVHPVRETLPMSECSCVSSE